MSLPKDFSFPSCVRAVSSFEELVLARFGAGVNAFCWERDLPGDFAEIATRLGDGEGIDNLDEERLDGLRLSPAGVRAREALLEDLGRLRRLELDPALNLIHGYPRDDDAEVVATDVFSFHADSAPVEADTWLCTYHGDWSEGVASGDVLRRVDDPETRAELLRRFGGGEGPEFQEFLRDNCLDLHYALKTGVKPYPFGLGNLWRIATDWPGSPVPPCVHRAPATRPGHPRLLLIS